MVLLPPKVSFESFNIDTVERAIIFAAICLEVGEQYGANLSSTSIEITPNVTRKDSFLIINASFNLDGTNYFASGGLVFNNLAQGDRPFKSHGGIATYLKFRSRDIEPTVGVIPTLPEFPDFFEYFEQYLLFYFFIYWASLGSSYNRNISMNFNKEEIENEIESEVDGEVVITTETNNEYSIDISLNLPVDFDKWLLGANYINAVKGNFSSYKVPNFDNYILTLSILDNTQLLTNEDILVN